MDNNWPQGIIKRVAQTLQETTAKHNRCGYCMLQHIFSHLLQVRAVLAKKMKIEVIFILADSAKEVAPSSNLFVTEGKDR